MYQDHKDLLSAFRAYGVKYLIIGGYAVSFHAQPRAAKDIDLFIQPDLTNAQAVVRPQDLVDVHAIRKATESRRPEKEKSPEPSGHNR